MKSIEFLTSEEIIQIHTDQIEHFGGVKGIRDINLLLSSVAMPQVTFNGNFLHEDIFAMAAAYLFHVVKNHPFVDGNKRVGLASAIIFLDLNGYECNTSQEDVIDLILSVVQEKMNKSDVAVFFKDRCKKIA